jgi:hypothetical protein
MRDINAIAPVKVLRCARAASLPTVQTSGIDETPMSPTPCYFTRAIP